MMPSFGGRSRQSSQATTTPGVQGEGLRYRVRNLASSFRKGNENSTPNVSHAISAAAELDPSKAQINTGHRYENITIYGTGPAQFGDQYITMQQHDFEAEKQRRISQFVASLKYAEMFSRLNEIKEAPYGTFAWIYDASKNLENDFQTWLSSEARTFLVSGKPGSGKSTFMKYVYQHPLTRTLLYSHQVSGQQPMILFHSFYRAGTKLQHDLKGMLASLLFQMIQADPSLLRVADTARLIVQSHLDDWSNMELRQLLYLMITELNMVSLLFLDGFDEFDENGDVKDLFQLLEDIQHRGNVKICVSSRPIPYILNQFKTVPLLKLHENTSSDIKGFVYQELSLMTRDDETILYTRNEVSQLTSAICTRAEGVFIWVHYVLRNVCNGIRVYDTCESLLQRIRLLPIQIEELYSEMWKKQNEDHILHRDESRRIFSYGRHFPMPLLQLALIIHPDILYSILREGKSVDFVKIQRICESTRRLVHHRSAGLIECIAKDDDEQSEINMLTIHPSYRRWSNTAVQFFHRSVQTFLEETPGGLQITGKRSADIDEAIDRLVLESNLGLHIQDEEYRSLFSCVDFAFSTAWLTQNDDHIVDKAREIFQSLHAFDENQRRVSLLADMLIRHDQSMFYDLDGLWATYSPMRTAYLLRKYGDQWSSYYKGYLAMCAVLHNVTWWNTPHTDKNTIEILKLLKQAKADLTSIQLYIQGNDKLCMRSPAGRLLLKPCVYFLSQPSPVELDLSFIQDVVTVLENVDLDGQYLTVFFSQYYATPGLVASVSFFQFTIENMSIGMVFAAADLYNALAQACKEHKMQSISQPDQWPPYGPIPVDPRQLFREACEKLRKKIYCVTDEEHFFVVREFQAKEADTVQNLVFAILNERDNSRIDIFQTVSRHW